MKRNTIGAFLFQHRGTIPALVLALTLIFHFNHLTAIDQQSFVLTNLYYLTGLALAIVGLIYRGVTIGQSPKGTSGRNTNRQLATVLNTTGMYSMSCNPLYFGNFLIWGSIVLLVGNVLVLLSFILFFGIFYTYIIKEEASFLEANFGSSYTTWKSRTPTFIPNPAKYCKSANQLNWRKIIRKEKNGVAAILIAFCLFRLMIPIQVFGTGLLEAIGMEWQWVTMCSVGMVYYLIIKVLVRKTSLLDNRVNQI